MTGGPWLVAAASAIGSSHLASGEPCQDAYACESFQCGDELPHYVIAVSDGAGSARYAREAATLATQEALGWVLGRLQNGTVLHLLSQEDASELIGHVQSCLQDAAHRANSELREFACTLLLAVINLHESFFVQLGDGAIVYSREAAPSEFELAFWPDTGEYANVTNFISDEDAALAVRSQLKAEGVAELAVFTDGLQRIVLDYESRRPFKPFFVPVFSQLRSTASAIDDSLRAFLESDRIAQRTDDDRTLVLLAKLSDEPPGASDDTL